jgi:F-type H+-transporting ATPase subunit gamma
MPSLIDLRRRIRSVKNMQQITKAMKMVSAAKLRRAQEHALGSRPYAAMMNRVLANVARAAAGIDTLADLPLLVVREEKKIQLIVVSSDTGLAGAFNANLLRLAQRFIDDHRSAELQIEAIGRKGRDHFRRRRYTLSGEHVGIVEKPNYEKAGKIADTMIERYSKAEVDAVYIAVNEFKSAMAPNLVLRKILPVELPEDHKNKDQKSEAGKHEANKDDQQVDYIYEQPPEELLRALLPRYVEMEIYRAMLESISAYHAARMTAMDAASKNAGDVIQDLTLNLNRVRQASITREIIEIVSGAAALA